MTSAGVLVLVIIVGAIAFFGGCVYQERKDACEISQQLNFMGLNSANVAKYC